jgi:aerobic-type carbon monoxide dehydrogenase small subunit (CoxS/CutS family)
MGAAGEDGSVRITVEVNGTAVDADVAPSTSLADWLRDDQRLTGTHLGCEQGVCGACNVIVDDEIVRSCLMLAVQADGRTVRTVEGVAANPNGPDLVDRFVRRRGFQCGFCTPGMAVLIDQLVERAEPLTPHQVREHLSGNICRCTGYEPILEVACDTLAQHGLLERP